MAKKKKDRISEGRIHRVERSQQQTRYITIGMFVILITVAALVIYGSIFQKYIMPDQPVAIVNGEEISTRDFQARVRFERLPLVNYWDQTARNAASFQDNPQLLEQFSRELQSIDFQLQPANFGQNILAQMINEVLVRQEAQRRGLTVSKEEVDEAIMEIFQFYPNGIPTPTVSPSPILVSTLSSAQIALVSPTPTTTETPTPTSTIETTETATATPENASTQEDDVVITTPEGTQTPTEVESTPATNTPSPTPTVYSTEAYAENVQQAYDYQELTVEFNEADFRKTIESQLYNEKLLFDLTNDLAEQEDQIWVRHIQAEDEESIQEILEKLEDGEDWTALAAEFSKDFDTSNVGGDLGWLGELNNKINAAEFIDQLYQAVVAADGEIGELIGPVESDSGWHIIQILGNETRLFSDDVIREIRGAIFTEWLNQAQSEYEIEVMSYVSRRTPDQPAPNTSLLNLSENLPGQ